MYTLEYFNYSIVLQEMYSLNCSAVDFKSLKLIQVALK